MEVIGARRLMEVRGTVEIVVVASGAAAPGLTSHQFSALHSATVLLPSFGSMSTDSESHGRFAKSRILSREASDFRKLMESSRLDLPGPLSHQLSKGKIWAKQ